MYVLHTDYQLDFNIVDLHLYIQFIMQLCCRLI